MIHRPARPSVVSQDRLACMFLLLMSYPFKELPASETQHLPVPAISGIRRGEGSTTVPGYFTSSKSFITQVFSM